MAGTARITVTVPIELVDELKRLTDNVSGFVSEAVAEKIRRRLRDEEFARYQAEHGDFTPEERAAAQHVLAAGAVSEPNSAE